jgi:hypothetical protein
MGYTARTLQQQNDVPRVERESETALRQLLYNAVKHTRVLSTFSQLTGSWDTFIMHLISLKCDVVTEQKWKALA